MEDIFNFKTNLIALWRPQKRTYHALTWHANQRHWRPSTVPVQGGLSKHKSTAHTVSGAVDIKLMNGAMIRVKAEGEFLMLGTTRITLVKRLGGTIPNTWKNHELGPLIERVAALDVSLWDVAPAVPAVTVAPAAPSATIQAIPKRIAWMVAEDAAKNEEKCPITMEPISPITASVTSCFHAFESGAIAAWLTNHDTCPQCRNKCVLTTAYSEA